MSSASIVGLILLFLGGTDALQAQRVRPTAIAYRRMSEPITQSQVVHSLDSVQVKSNKTRNVWIGIAVGAALGGGSAYVLSKRSCGQGPFVCDDSAPVVLPTVLFTILGGIVGGTAVHVLSRSSSSDDTKDTMPPSRLLDYKSGARSMREWNRAFP